jgi:chromosome segregation ATPase
MRTVLKVFLFLFLFGAGLAIGGGYGHVQLEKTRETLQAEIQEQEQRGTLLKKKYAEQKALVGQFMRAKARLEGRARTLQKELEEIQAQKDSAQGTSSALRATIQKKEEEIVFLNRRITQLEQNLDEELNKQKQLVTEHKKALAQMEEERSKVEVEKEDLQASLERSQRAHDRCRDRNARLCVIAIELVEKYKNKGVGDALAQKEPFTQAGKVELEKLVQEYKYRIEDEKMKAK